jgi:hypothetical protein
VSRATNVSGCWSGTWQSCVTPHRGPLNAEFVRLDASSYPAADAEEPSGCED